MKKIKLLLYTSAILILGWSNASAQLGDIVNPQPTTAPPPLNKSPSTASPNVASLGVFGSIPISKYTGQPEISIPLFSLNNGEALLPINLSYNSAMVKPDVHPGWAGLGWDVNVFGGGVISRNIKDMPDENNRCFLDFWSNQIFPSAGFYSLNGSASLLQGNNWETELSRKPEDPQYDTEPDEFSFKFMGFSGKFFLSENGSWKVRSDQDIKVVFEDQFIVPDFPISSYKSGKMNGLPGPICNIAALRAFRTFTLIDDKGVKYIFGDSEHAIEYNISYTAQHWDDWLATSWFLTKIIWPDGRNVALTYQREKIIVDLQVAHTIDGSTVYINNQSDCSGRSVSGPLAGHVISPVYLKNISASWGENISFYHSKSDELFYPVGAPIFQAMASNYMYSYNATRFVTGDIITETNKLEWRKLDSIKYSNATSNRTLAFKYNINFSNQPKQRLMLSSITESSNGLSKKPYYFKYSLYYDVVDRFPNYLSGRTDHWGYFNDVEAPSDLLFSEPEAYYETRQATEDIYVLATNFLTKIIYPTGGSSTFEYEPGQYSAALDSTRTNLILYNYPQYGGAPRIKSIIDHSGENPATRRDFFYTKGYRPGEPSSDVSSGILSGVPKYDYHNIEEFTVPGSSTHMKIYYDLKTTNKILPTNDEFFYNPVGYSEVTEVQSYVTDPTKFNGYTTYKYTSFDDGHFDDQAKLMYPAFHPFYPVSSRAFERGRLKSTEIFNSAGALLQATKIYWGNKTINGLNERNQFARAFSYRQMVRCAYTTPLGGGFEYSTNEVGAYRLYYYPFRPLKEETFIYSPNGEVLTQTKTYKYSKEYNQLKELAVSNSAADSVKTYYKYAFDLVPSFGPGVGTYREMIQNNMVSLPIATIKSIKRSGEELVTAAHVNRYSRISFLAADGSQKIIPKLYSELSMNSAVPLPKNQFDPYNIYIDGIQEKETIHTAMRPITTYSYSNRGDFSFITTSFQPVVKNKGTSFLWDRHANNHGTGNITAKIINTYQDDPLAVENFENYTDWLRDANMVTTSDSRTGRKSGNIAGKILRAPFELGLGKYKISYWYKGQRPSIKLKEDVTDIDPVILQEDTQPGINGWNRYEATIELQYLAYLYLDGSALIGTQLIDDVFLIPNRAEITTYTYDNAVGMTSMTDVKGMTIYYEYDSFGRLKTERDHLGRVLKVYDYNYRP